MLEPVAEVGMVIDQLTEGLDAGDHARDDVAAFEHLPIDLDSSPPSGTGQFAQQVAVVATENSEPLGDREDKLPMRNRNADGLADRFGGQQGALLMAVWTEAALLAGKGDEHFVSTIGTTDAGEAEVQIAAAEKSTGHIADDRSPRTVLFCVSPVIGSLELGQVTLNGFAKRRLPRLARAVNRRWLGGETDQGNATFRFQCGKGGGAAVDLSVEGYKNTPCR